MDKGGMAFWYYIAAYSIGLPTLAAIALAFAKDRDPRLSRYFAFFLSITLQLICVAVLRFQDATNPSTMAAAARRAYFLAESTLIFALPRLCNAMTGAPRARFLDRAFLAAFALAVGLLLSPFALRYDESANAFRALPGFIAYRILFFSSLAYGILLLALKFRSVAAGGLKIFAAFAAFALFSLSLSLWETLHCELFPVLHTAHRPLPLSPIAYFASCAAFIAYIAKEFLAARPPRAAAAPGTGIEGYGLSGREREIALLLAAGQKNREIGERLFIAESTVKSHVKSIYRKLGVSNRVGLVRALDAHPEPPPKE
jgi:DNA-binding CsgD family transcriptional regulator